MTTTDISEAKTGASYWHRQFDLQQNMNDDLRAQVARLEADLEEHRHVIAEARALHHESKWSEIVSYCIMCAERWPCESVLILLGADDVSEETVEEGVDS